MRQWPASVEGQTPVPLGDIQKYSKEVQIDLTVAHQDLEVRFPGIGRADHLSILHCPDDAEVWLKIDSPQAHPIRVRGQGAGISGFDSAPFERVFITNDPYAGGSVPPALIMQAGGDTGFKLTPVHSGDRVRVVDTVGIRRTDLHHITPADDVGVVPVDDTGTPLMTPTNPGRMLLHGSLPAGTNEIGAVQLNGSIAEGLSRRFIGINRIMVVGEIAAQTTETVHTYTHGADIEFLEFSTNIENAVSMELEAFKPDGTTAGAIFIIGNSADSTKPLTPLQLREHKSALFELLVDDEGTYKIGLRRQMPVGNGFKVSIKNSSADTAYRYGLFIYYNKCAV